MVITRLNILVGLRRTMEKSNERFHNYTSKILEVNPKYGVSWGVEQEITNQLGYEPIREAMHESHEDNEIGLLRHLANMDYVVLYRIANAIQLRTQSVTSALGALEDCYIELERENEDLRRTHMIMHINLF